MNAFVTSCITTANVEPLSKFPLVLLSEDEVKIVKWVLLFRNRFGGVPSIDRLVNEFMEFTPISSSASVPELFEEAVARKKRNAVVEAASRLLSGEDPKLVANELLAKTSADIMDVEMFSTFDRDNYFRRGTPIWLISDHLTSVIGGLFGGELCYIIGRLGAGKTLLMQWSIYQWWKAGKRILLTSNEMGVTELMLRLDGFLAGINPAKIRRGEDISIKSYRMATHVAANSRGDIIIPKRKPMNPKDIENLISSYEPDVVSVDGVYLLSPNDRQNSSWESMANVSRSLKEMALKYNVPIVGTSQANRNATKEKVTAYDIAYSDAFGQDGDVIIGLSQAERNEVVAEIIKNRNSALASVNLTFDFDTMRIFEDNLII